MANNSHSKTLPEGVQPAGKVHLCDHGPELVEHAIRRGEGCLSSRGALAVRTGPYTGRQPKDRFLVDEPSTASTIDWGAVNQPVHPGQFEALWQKGLAHLAAQPELFDVQAHAGADLTHAVNVRVLTDQAWQALFSHCLFRAGALPGRPEVTVLAAGTCPAIPAPGGSSSEVFVGLDLAGRRVLIMGTLYAGEIKKSIFSFLNWWLPSQDVLPMHCSATMGASGDTALYFGLSGTGKTTLSADPRRKLIGDDEHGWSPTGIFNFEGGCYAKTINLKAETEPEIHNALGFGSILENVPLIEPARHPDFFSSTWTENTRGAYPLTHIPGRVPDSLGTHPSHVIFLTCDAFGVLPPVAALSPDDALFHFLLGYTAKVAGTEQGVSQPTATFSACFGAPFMPRDPETYATMLRDRLQRHGSRVWLVNTGWAGGPASGPHAGSRMPLAFTRGVVDAILANKLNNAPLRPNPMFRLSTLIDAPGAGIEVLKLDPRRLWQDPEAYDRAAADLAQRFQVAASGKHASTAG